MGHRYPYQISDRLLGLQLNNDFELSSGAAPPNGALGGAGRYKFWMDTSVNPPALRIATAARAAAGVYNATEWATLGTLDLTNRVFNFQGIFSPAGNVTVPGTLHVTGATTLDSSLVVGGTAGFNSTVKINGGGATALNVPNGGISTGGGLSVSQAATIGGTINGHTLNSCGIGYPAYAGHVIAFEWTGTYLNAHVDCTASPGSIAIINQNATFAALTSSTLTVSGAAGVHALTTDTLMVNQGATFASNVGITGTLQVNGGGTNALSVPNGGIVTNGGLSTGLNVAAGQDLTATRDATIGRNLTVTNTSTFGSLMTLNGGAQITNTASLLTNGLFVSTAGGTGAIQANNGGISTAGDFTHGGGNFSVRGGPGDSGRLRLYNMNSRICFRYDGASVFYRVDEVRENRILTSGNIDGSGDPGYNGISVASDSGSPTGYSIFHYSGGTNYTTTVSGTSDARLKTNIRDTEVDALAAILATPVRAFEWTREYRRIMPNLRDAPIGLVAQEVEALMPYVVGVSEHDGYRRIAYDHLAPYLLRALQQLADRVRDLERRLTQ